MPAGAHARTSPRAGQAAAGLLAAAAALLACAAPAAGAAAVTPAGAVVALRKTEASWGSCSVAPARAVVSSAEAHVSELVLQKRAVLSISFFSGSPTEQATLRTSAVARGQVFQLESTPLCNRMACPLTRGSHTLELSVPLPDVGMEWEGIVVSADLPGGPLAKLFCVLVWFTNSTHANG